MEIRKCYGILACFLILITLVYAEDSIGQRQDAQVGTPYIASQPCASCTFMDITILTKDGIVLENAAMINNGSTWIYNFTPNDSLRHDVNGFGDKNGINDSFAFWFDATLSGGQNDSTIILSDILLLLTVIGLIFIIGKKYSKTNFNEMDKKITDEHRNMGTTFVKGLLYGLFKNVFIWYYFLGWIFILILKDIVYRFNSAEIYSYFTLMANIYSIGLLLVTVYMIGWFITYMRNMVNVLTDNDWGVGNGE